MKKRIYALLLALLLMGAMTLPAAASTRKYSDVPSKHWAAQSIARATELGIFKGVSGSKFGLGRSITRAEFVTALVRFFGWKTVKPGKATFSDVKVGTWYYESVETALAHQAVTAAGPTFRPNDNITRVEMFEILIRGLGYASLAGQVEEKYSVPFTDVAVRKGFIAVAYDLGIAAGVSAKRFNPDGNATREQAAAVLIRTYDKLYAQSTQVSRISSGYARVTVETPKAKEGTAMPITPLEPILELYGALRSLKQGGQDMSQAVLCLNAGGVRTVVSGGSIAGSERITAEEMAEILASSGVTTHYSDRYESAYCIYAPNGYQTATVWYQSPESQAVKLQLARLFGVTKYYMA